MNSILLIAIIVCSILFLFILYSLYQLFKTAKQYRIEMKKLKEKLRILNLKIFFNELSQLFQINNYVYEILKNVCKEENIFFFEVPDNIINKNVIDENKKAAGRYTHINKLNVYEMNQYTKTAIMINENDKNFNEMEWSFPNIMINTDLEYFHNKQICRTLAHELGHHFIHTKGEKQSEELANKYMFDVFIKYLPKIFIAIFISSLSFRTKFNEENLLNDNELENYYQLYLQFREQHPELELPLYKF